MLLRLLPLARAPGELAQAEVAVRDERPHAAWLGEGQRLAVVGFSALSTEPVRMSRDVAEQVQSVALSQLGRGEFERAIAETLCLVAASCPPEGRAPLSGSTQRSAVEPGRHEPPTVVEAVVWSPAFHVGLPRRHDPLRCVVEIIRMLRDVPLDVIDDLAALADVRSPSLEPDQLGQLRVVDASGVERLTRHEGAIKIAVRLGPGAAKAEHHLVELSEDCA